MTTDAQLAHEPVIATGRGFLRLSPQEAAAAHRRGSLIVDIRPVAVRRRDGDIPGALVVAGPLREWRLGPDSPERGCELGDRRAGGGGCGGGGGALLPPPPPFGVGGAGAAPRVG